MDQTTETESPAQAGAETTTPTTTPTTPTASEQSVPIDRFNAVIEAKKAALARVAELEAKVTEASTAAARVPQLEEALAVTRAGLADERGQAVARTLYGQLPEAERPATLAEYVAAKPAELAFWMGQAQPAAPTTAAKSAPSAGAAPATGAAPAASKGRTEQVREASTALSRAIATGDATQIQSAISSLDRVLASVR
jgi:hypothetical protein